MKRVLFFTVFVLIIVSKAEAQKEKLQLAYIYQFTKLIEWCPAYKTGNFVIGVLGNASILGFTSDLQKKTVVSQAIVVKKFASVSDIDRCNILFVPAEKSGQLAAINKKIGSNCTLVISEKEGMAQKGAAINLIELGGKIVYELNKEALDKHSLNVNSQLVKSAKTVY